MRHKKQPIRKACIVCKIRSNILNGIQSNKFIYWVRWKLIFFHMKQLITIKNILRMLLLCSEKIYGLVFSLFKLRSYWNVVLKGHYNIKLHASRPRIHCFRQWASWRMAKTIPPRWMTTTMGIKTLSRRKTSLKSQ